MKQDASLADLVLDLLSPLGGVTRRFMFGGWGFYRDGLFFALIADGRFYLKSGPVNIAEFEAAGLAPWVYPTAKGPIRMSYHEAPESVLTNPSLMKAWALKGLAAAAEAAAKKKKKSPSREPAANSGTGARPARKSSRN